MALDQISGATPRNRATRDPSIYAPNVQVLAAFQETRTWDSASINRVLDLMVAHGLRPNLVTINILLAGEIRSRNYRGALAMYSMLKEMGITTKNISPDGATFGSMFLLYRNLRFKTVRKLHANDLASPSPPRALYHDFMLAVKPRDRTKGIVPTTRLMNAIFRAFIWQHDYAGAFVVLSSYFLLKVPLDHRTYHHIVKHVLDRVWSEVTRHYNGEVGLGWCLMFLGVPHYEEVNLNGDLVRNLLAFISQDIFHSTSPLYALPHHMPSNADPRYKLPSRQMMKSVFLVDREEFNYDPVPLKRILRRAILAKLRLENPNAGSADISKAIVDAKVDMLPNNKSSTSSKDWPPADISKAIVDAEVDMLPKSKSSTSSRDWPPHMET